MWPGGSISRMMRERGHRLSASPIRRQGRWSGPRCRAKVTPSTTVAPADGPPKRVRRLRLQRERRLAPAHRRIVRGSRASRTPSPRKLNASDTTRMTQPGRIVTCGARRSTTRPVGDHRAPVRGRRLHAEAEKAEAGADDDHQSHQRRGVDDDRREDVGQHVPQHDRHGRAAAARAASMKGMGITPSVAVRASRAKYGNEDDRDGDDLGQHARPHGVRQWRSRAAPWERRRPRRGSA